MVSVKTQMICIAAVSLLNDATAVHGNRERKDAPCRLLMHSRQAARPGDKQAGRQAPACNKVGRALT